MTTRRGGDGMKLSVEQAQEVQNQAYAALKEAMEVTE